MRLSHWLFTSQLKIVSLGMVLQCFESVFSDGLCHACVAFPIAYYCQTHNISSS